MKRKHDTASQQDRELSRRFRQMREQDAQRVPDFPGEEALAERSPITVANQPYSTARKIAVAAAVVVVAVGVLMTRPPRQDQDPGAIYADILRANNMATDQLMQVSYAVAPEITRMPDIFEIDLSVGPAQITK